MASTTVAAGHQLCYMYELMFNTGSPCPMWRFLVFSRWQQQQQQQQPGTDPNIYFREFVVQHESKKCEQGLHCLLLPRLAVHLPLAVQLMQDETIVKANTFFLNRFEQNREQVVRQWSDNTVMLLPVLESEHAHGPHGRSASGSGRHEAEFNTVRSMYAHSHRDVHDLCERTLGGVRQVTCMEELKKLIRYDALQSFLAAESQYDETKRTLLDVLNDKCGPGKLEQLRETRIVDDTSRNAIKALQSALYGRVISPVYDVNMVYTIYDLDFDITAHTPLNMAKLESLQQYFQEKYSIQIQDDYQPILLVSQSTKNLGAQRENRRNPNLLHMLPEVVFMRSRYFPPSMLRLSKILSFCLEQVSNGVAYYHTHMQHIQSKIGYQFNNPMLLLRALTHKSYSAEMAAGAYASFERLEFIGDAVLDYVVSLYLMNTCFNASEGELSRRRVSIVCNQSLRPVAMRLGISPSVVLLGKGMDSTEVTESSIYSDMVEAIIGAIFLDNGLSAATTFVMNHIICPDTCFGPICDLNAWKRELLFTATEEELSLAFELERCIGHRFKELSLPVYVACRWSPNVTNPRIATFERLEFLGDTILKFISGLYIFLQDHLADEGTMTQRRARYVSNEHLIHVAHSLKIRDVVPMPRTIEKDAKAVADIIEALIACIFLDAGLHQHGGESLMYDLHGDWICRHLILGLPSAPQQHRHGYDEMQEEEQRRLYMFDRYTNMGQQQQQQQQQQQYQNNGVSAGKTISSETAKHPKSALQEYIQQLYTKSEFETLQYEIRPSHPGYIASIAFNGIFVESDVQMKKKVAEREAAQRMLDTLYAKNAGSLTTVQTLKTLEEWNRS